MVAVFAERITGYGPPSSRIFYPALDRVTPNGTNAGRIHHRWPMAACIFTSSLSSVSPDTQQLFAQNLCCFASRITRTSTPRAKQSARASYFRQRDRRGEWSITVGPPDDVSATMPVVRSLGFSYSATTRPYATRSKCVNLVLFCVARVRLVKRPGNRVGHPQEDGAALEPFWAQIDSCRLV